MNVFRQTPERQHVVVVGPVTPHRGGVAQHSAQLAAALATADHDVTLESWRKQYPSLLYRRAEQDPKLTPSAGSRFDLRWYDPISWVRVARRHRGADVLVIQWVTPFNFAAISVLRWLMKPKRTVAVIHNAKPHEWFPLVGPLSRLALRGLDQAICHANAIVDDLKSLRIVAAKTAVVGHPPNIDISPTELPPRPPIRLLFLGYLRHYKGADLAVSSLAHLVATRPDIDLHLTVAGEAWSNEDSVGPQVSAAGLDSRVTIVERYVSDDEMVQLIADHHLLVAPYRSATQSGVISLAVGGGRAVVATDVGGLAEVVIHGVNGVCCPPDDIEAFSSATVEAIERLDELTLGAVQQAVSWAEVADLVLG